MKVMFNYDREKMKALEMYAEQKGVSLQDELAQAADNLYQKIVPGNVKAFIASRAKYRRPRKKPSESSVSAVGDAPAEERAWGIGSQEAEPSA